MSAAFWQRIRQWMLGAAAPSGAGMAGTAPFVGFSASDLPGGTSGVVSRAEAGLSAVLGDRYELVRLIGRGGMSSVFLARDLRHGRDVAIKVMIPERMEAGGPDRFLSEIRVTAGLQHPNILPLFDSGEAAGCLYYIMPYIEGESLDVRLRRERPLSLDTVRVIVGTVAAALDHAHRSGVVHRDIKPGNVLLRGGETYVADFGISLVLESVATGTRLTATGAALGTPVYMSPEQIDGTEEVDGRADVYALGCVTYEMLTGEPPFAGSTARAVMLRHLYEVPPSAAALRQGLSPAVDAVIQRAMAKAPVDRFDTAGEFAAALGVALDGAGAAAPRAAVSWRLEQEIRFCRTRDGVRLAFATSGVGLPIIKTSNWLSHLEFDATSPMWRHWWKGLSERYRLVRYDERGSGLSDREVADIGMEAWVRDLEAVVDAAGLERFALLGVSRGGAIALAYAARHPERVSHLVLHGAYCVGRGGREDPELKRQMQMELGMVRYGWGQENPAFRQAFTTLFFPGASPDQMQWFNELQRVTTSPETAARMFEASWNLDVRAEARLVTAPTLVLHCTRDARIPFEEGRRIAALVPGARFVPLESANHIPLEHEPAWGQFLAELERFVAQ